MTEDYDAFDDWAWDEGEYEDPPELSELDRARRYGAELLARRGVGEKRLTAFLYMLMRDEVPVGTVGGICKDLQANDDKEFVYSTEELEELSARHAKWLLGIID